MGELCTWFYRGWCDVRVPCKTGVGVQQLREVTGTLDAGVRRYQVAFTPPRAPDEERWVFGALPSSLSGKIGESTCAGFSS